MIFKVSQGATVVPGTITYSGQTATFIPTSSLVGNMVYTVTISSGVESGDDDHQAANTYTWSFTTA